MCRIYKIMRDGKAIKTRKEWCYDDLGTAKRAARSHIRQINKKLPKDSKLKFEDFAVEEYDLRIIEKHKI